MTILVVRDGNPVFRRGYGVTDLRTLRPIDAKTDRRRLASFTKQFTAACIMLLARDGKRYDDHLTDITRISTCGSGYNGNAEVFDAFYRGSRGYRKHSCSRLSLPAAGG